MQANVFDSDIFTLTSLTAAVNKQDPVPGRIGQLGLFQEAGVTTTTVSIESKEGKLSLVKNTDRGAPGQVAERVDRKMISFSTMHLPQVDTVMADEVQNVRAFGTESQLQPIQTLVNDKQAIMRANLDATTEYHRVGAIQGKVMDSDGETVINDLYTQFGVTKQTKTIDFSATDFDARNLGRELKRDSKRQLGNVMVPRHRVLCGSEFFNDLISAESTKAAWERYNDGEALRNDPMGGFMFGGVIWEEYADEINGDPLIDADKAHFVPEGVNGLFITRFAPANLMTTVNTMGLPYYSHVEPIGERGVELYVQSNPIHLCTVPGAIIELTSS